MSGGRTALVSAVAIVVIVLGVVYFGVYSVAADEPHWKISAGAIGYVRDRSIATRAGGVSVPDLTDGDRIALGAEHYAAMCTGCHLAPGTSSSELRDGLYPQPPDLSREGARRAPAEQFWIIKHGLKMTAMPAWGASHDDDVIWGLVAFLRQLPGMDSDTYRRMVSEEGEEAADHHEHEHEHDDGKGDIDSSASASGHTSAGGTAHSQSHTTGSQGNH